MTFRGRHRAMYITKYQPMYIVNPVFYYSGYELFLLFPFYDYR